VTRISYGVTAVPRRARVEHRCETGHIGPNQCLGTICPGDMYLLITVYPSNELVGRGHPYSSAECRNCAAGRGRDHLLTQEKTR
jgi:hypothetical protein